MIARILCFLSFHNFKLIEEVGSVEVYCCTRCHHRWAVETERQQVHHIPKQDVFSIQDEAI